MRGPSRTPRRARHKLTSRRRPLYAAWWNHCSRGGRARPSGAAQRPPRTPGEQLEREADCPLHDSGIAGRRRLTERCVDLLAGRVELRRPIQL